MGRSGRHGSGSIHPLCPSEDRARLRGRPAAGPADPVFRGKHPPPQSHRPELGRPFLTCRARTPAMLRRGGHPVQCPNGEGPTSLFGLSSSYPAPGFSNLLAAESGMEPQSPHHSQKYFHSHRGRGSATSIYLDPEAAQLLTRVIPCLWPQEEAKHHTQQLTQRTQSIFSAELHQPLLWFPE